MARHPMTTPAVRHYPDHFLLGISELEKGIEQIAGQTGVRPRRGGVHPYIGTRNALLSLGEASYLEVIAPDPDRDPAILDPAMVERVLRPLLQMESLTPFFWMIGSTDLDHSCGLLEAEGFQLTSPQAGSRLRPDGTVLRWRMSSVHGSGSEWLPYIIQWDNSSESPARHSPTGCTLDRFSLSAPDLHLARRFAGCLGMDIPMRESRRPGLELALRTPAGRVRLAAPDE
jgi:hypothetical protein